MLENNYMFRAGGTGRGERGGGRMRRSGKKGKKRWREMNEMQNLTHIKKDIEKKDL